MANRRGKQIAITCISPMRPWRTLCLRVVVFIRSLGLLRGPSRKLKELSFIHFARWVIVNRHSFPNLGQPKENLRYDYLFFCSNFNGSWEEYIDAFSHILPGGMDNIWRWSEKYPKSIPVGPFKKYIQANQVDADHYYSAYPGASTNDVKRAIDLRRKLHQFREHTNGMSADQFADEYAKFLCQAAGDLQTTGPFDA